VKEIQQDIKSGKFRRLYLFFGEERYLINHWREALISTACGDSDANLSRIEGKAATADAIAENAEPAPFFADWRVVVIRDSGLFAAGRKDESDKVSEYLKDLPEWAIVIFDENSVDKRGKMYKTANSAGLIYDAATPKENELIRWIGNIFKDRKKAISPASAAMMIRQIGSNMALLHTEARKVCDFLGERVEVAPEDIVNICTKSTEAGIFDLLAAVGKKQTGAAIGLYREMLAQKEAPLMILAMLARQFRFAIQCGYLSASLNQKEIAARLALSPYAVREFVNLSRTMPQAAAIAALRQCLQTDYRIKTGQISDELALEILISNICTL